MFSVAKRLHIILMSFVIKNLIHTRPTFHNDFLEDVCGW